MIDKSREITLIDTIREIYKDATCEAINNFDYKNNKFPEKYTIEIDRFILNDLNVFLQNHKRR
jgi:hypothetical protein